MNHLLKKLQAYSYGIWYHPLPDERDSEPFFTDHGLSLTHRLILPQDRRSSPEDQATRIHAWLGSQPGYILVPGRQFDRHGGRQGRGGGWYDRLLAQLPSNVLRIGVTEPSRLSPTPLSLNPWDQPVDWLLIAMKDRWETYETHARETKSPIPPDPIGV